MKTLLTLSCLILLAGCATTPIPTKEASPVRPRDFSRPAPNTGQVIVKRDSGFVGAACAARLLVDGVFVAELRPSQKVVLHIPEGHHIFGVQSSGDLCSGKLVEIRQVIVRATTSTFRLASRMGSGVAIMPAGV